MVTSNILIIDDDPGLLKALPELLHLQLKGVNVTTTSSPREALEWVAHTDYDAIVSDIEMPGMDGLTLLTEIRALRPDTPILLMTSHDDRDLVLYALRGGAYDFIQKPLDRDYFLVSLQRAAQTRQLRRQVAEQKLALERHAEDLEEAVQKAVSETQVAHRRLAFLAEASTLLASSLDYEATLSRVARMAILYLADYCVVDVVEEDGSLRCVEVAHVDRRQEVLVRRTRNLYKDYPDPPYPPFTVIKTGQSLLYSEVTPAILQESSVNNEQLQLLYQLGLRSAMLVPLKVSGRLLGVLSFIVTKPGRRYGTDDLSLAEDLARRASLAIDNARLYEETQQAIQVRDQFLSVAAHELKTPMTSILGTTQLLLRRLERTRSVEDRELNTLRLLANQTHRLNRLVDSLLNLSRLEAGQLTIDHDKVDVAALVRRTVDEMSLAIETHNVECVGADQPLLVTGDELRLEQVLQNLLQNAIKYSPNGGKISIHLEPYQDMALISIADQGLGIPETALPQLFNRFYRAENPAFKLISGIGLGLYVVREIVKMHGGTVEVESTEGQGSTFTVRLPLYQPEPAAINKGEKVDVSV